MIIQPKVMNIHAVAIAGDRHLKSYLQNGYVAEEAGPASSTMEYAYDDWCFAEFAKALGKISTYNIFIQRSKNYKNIFDNRLKLVRQKHEDGTWVEPFNAYKYGTIGGWNGKGFMEGTPFQYSFFVPQDVPALISLMGRDTFIKRLEFGFNNDLFDLEMSPAFKYRFCLIMPEVHGLPKSIPVKLLLQCITVHHTRVG